MFYPFNRKNSQTVRRAALVGAVTVACAVTLCSCAKKTPAPESEPTLNLVESTAPTTAETAPPTTEAVKKDIAIVKEQLNVRSSPSMESNVISQLDAGDEVEVLRIEGVNGIEWAYARQGWIPTELLDMSNVAAAQSSTNSTPNNPNATEPTEPEATTAPAVTEPVAPPQNADGTTSGNGETTNNAAGQRGIVTANGLNIRDSASTAGNVVGSMGFGERVILQETSDGWGKTAKGWISLNYVYLDGTRGTNPCDGIVTTNAVNVRSGPGVGYGVVTTVNANTRVNVMQRFDIDGKTWGCIKNGWICMDYVYIDGTDVEGQSGTATVTGNNLNIRSGPGTNYASVGSLNADDTIHIYAQFTYGDVTWGCTDRGWVCMDYVRMN